jgi:hypothetical protein
MQREDSLHVLCSIPQCEEGGVHVVLGRNRSGNGSFCVVWGLGSELGVYKWMERQACLAQFGEGTDRWEFLRVCASISSEAVKLGLLIFTTKGRCHDRDLGCKPQRPPPPSLLPLQEPMHALIIIATQAFLCTGRSDNLRRIVKYQHDGIILSAFSFFDLSSQTGRMLVIGVMEITTECTDTHTATLLDS